MKKILVVEDDRDMSRLLEYNLRKGYAVDCAADGDEGLKMARRTRPALIILDLMLPKMDGLEVCRALKRDEKTSAIPILMLTAKAEEADKVMGLDTGADDYVTKPFSPRELVARVGSILRRTMASAGDVFKHGMLRIDFGKYTASFKGQAIPLTTKEFLLMKALVDARGQALPRAQLLQSVWGYDHGAGVETRTVDVHITHLRQKLPSLAKRVVSVKGVGYRLDLTHA